MRKAIHPTILCSLLPLTYFSKGWWRVNALVPEEEDEKGLCVQEEKTRLPTKPLLHTLPSFALSSSAVKHTCELTHQVLVDKLTSHLQGRVPPPPPFPYMAFLQGGGPPPSVTEILYIEIAYTSCLLPTVEQRDIFNTTLSAHLGSF